MEDDTNADEDIVTNPAEKYRKFEEMASRGFFPGSKRHV